MIYDLPLIAIPVSNWHLFSDINISQGSVAMRLRCGGIFSYHFTANLPTSLTVKEFWKSVKIWQIYRHEFGGPVFFWNTVYIHRCFRLDVRKPVLRRWHAMRHEQFPFFFNAFGFVLFLETWRKSSQDLERRPEWKRLPNGRRARTQRTRCSKSAEQCRM